jgi:putative transposase
MPRKSSFTDEQMIRAVREVESGAFSTDVARKLGVTEQTIYRWKQRFSGLEVADAARLRRLEEENGRLKKLLADQLLDNEALKLVLAKKW